MSTTTSTTYTTQGKLASLPSLSMLSFLKHDNENNVYNKEKLFALFLLSCKDSKDRKKLHTVRKTWILRPITWTAATLQIEAPKRAETGKSHTPRTVTATEKTVWATENPVAQTLSVQTPPLNSVREGVFRPPSAENLIELTKAQCLY